MSISRAAVEEVLRDTRENSKAKKEETIKKKQEEAVRAFLEENLDPRTDLVPATAEYMRSNNLTLVDLIMGELHTYQEYGNGRQTT